MKLPLLFSLAIIFFGCSDNTTTVITHELQVSPHSLTFAHGESVKTLSVTHSCTCPFSWNLNVLTVTQVLKDTSGTGDNTRVPIWIDRTKLTTDTLVAALQVKADGYGIDTVAITVFK
jgi:hypothetical protein